MLDAYAVYMRNHGKALAVIDETAKKKSAFVFYLQQVKAHPQSGSWDLKMFLITPVQRLLRYSLLFKDYRNRTPETHEDYIHTLNLLAILEKHATLVNSAISREENRSKLQEIAASFSSLPKPVSDLVLSDHVFIRSGPLTKVCRKTNMRRWFWLFSDCLIYGKATGVGAAPQGFAYHRHFPLAKVRVKNLPESDGLFSVVSVACLSRSHSRSSLCGCGTELVNAFQVITTEKSFTVMADTPQEKDVWLLAFRDALRQTKRPQGSVDGAQASPAAPDAEQDSPEAPVWVPDRMATQCMICGTTFSVIKRRVCCSALSRTIARLTLVFLHAFLVSSTTAGTAARSCAARARRRRSSSRVSTCRRPSASARSATTPSARSSRRRATAAPAPPRPPSSSPRPPQTPRSRRLTSRAARGAAPSDESSPRPSTTRPTPAHTDTPHTRSQVHARVLHDTRNRKQTVKKKTRRTRMVKK